MRNVLVRGVFSTSIPTVDIPPESQLPDPTVDIRPPALPQLPGPNRRMRRRQKVFETRLKKRLEADETPVAMETLPDGGIHVTVKKS